MPSAAPGAGRGTYGSSGIGPVDPYDSGNPLNTGPPGQSYASLPNPPVFNSNPFAGATAGSTTNPFAGATAGGSVAAGNPQVQVPTYTGAPGQTYSPPAGQNYYYDPASGNTYVYDSNWNYVSTMQGNQPFAGATAGSTPNRFSGATAGGSVAAGGNTTFNPAVGGFDSNGQWHDPPGGGFDWRAAASAQAPQRSNMMGSMSPWVTSDAGANIFQVNPIRPVVRTMDEGGVINQVAPLGARTGGFRGA